MIFSREHFYLAILNGHEKTGEVYLRYYLRMLRLIDFANCTGLVRVWNGHDSIFPFCKPLLPFETVDAILLNSRCYSDPPMSYRKSVGTILNRRCYSFLIRIAILAGWTFCLCSKPQLIHCALDQFELKWRTNTLRTLRSKLKRNSMYCMFIIQFKAKV